MTMILIQRALFDHLSDWPELGLPVAWPGKRFEPENDQGYVRAEFIPAQTQQTGQEIGPDAPIRESGFAQFTVLYPMKAGPGAVQKKAAALQSRFRWRQTLTAQDSSDPPVTVSVNIKTSSQVQMDSDESWLSIAVVVAWTAVRPGGA